MRLLLAIPIGILAALSVFWGMQWMISPSAQTRVSSEDIAMVDFIRTLKDTETQKKEREKKEPPKPKTPPTPQMPQLSEKKNTPKAPNLDLPKIDSTLSSFKGDALGSMLNGYGVGDSDIVPLVRAEPRYPQQAKARKLEGYVRVRLVIDETGSVDDVEVIESEPRGVFEREAIRAAWRCKFSPKQVDGQAVSQVATMKYEFKMEK